MTTLGPAVPVPGCPRRILVSGCSGSGKTTVARAISAHLDLPHQELDALFHGPGWTRRPGFVDDVTALVATDRWVSEYQYSAVRARLLDRAELFVWLDLPRWRVFSQLVPRTLLRRLRRTPLWNGNVEPPLRTILTERDHIVRWAWRTYPDAARRAAEALARKPVLPVVRLRSRREVTAWLAHLPPHPCPHTPAP